MGVQETLARLRAGLLDLSDRNPLLNFSHPRHACLGLVGERPNDLYARLLGGETFSFQPAAAPHKPTSSIDWPKDTGGQRESRPNGVLQTAHDRDELARLLRRLHRQAETVVEETGITMLFLAFGFLEWHDPATPNKPLLAPLLLVPVTLKKASTHESLGSLNYSLEYSGEEIVGNLALAERFMRLDIPIPPVADEDVPEQYVAKIEQLPGLQPDWLVRRWLTLSLLPVGDAIVYRDLDQSRWYEPQSFLGNQLVHDWLDEPIGAPPAAQESECADLPDDGRTPLPVIFEADASQQAVLAGTQQGRNLVVQAPPGTGRTHTIANLVAAALAGGQSVLVVSAKRAALDRVHRLLEEAGFEELCLDLHRRTIRTEAFLRAIDRRMHLVLLPPDSAGLAEAEREQQDLQDELRAYAELLERPVEGVNRSIADVLWERELCLQRHPGLRPLETSLCQLEWTPEAGFEFGDLRRRATLLQNRLAALSTTSRRLTDHPWFGVGSAPSEDELTASLEAGQAVVQQGESLQALTDRLRDLLGAPVFTRQDELRQLVEWDGTLPSVTPSAAPELLEALRDGETRRLLAQFIADLETIAQERLTLASDFRNVPSDVDRIDLTPLRAIRGSGLEGLPLEQFESTVGLLEAVVHDLRLVHEALQGAVEGIGIQGPITLPFVECFDQTISLLIEVPFDLLRMRDPILLDDSLSAVRRAGAERGAQLQDRRRTLSLEYLIPIDYDLDELETHAKALQSTAALARFYSGAYRRARRFFMEVHQGGKAADSRVMADAVWDLRDHLELSRRFAAQPEYREAFGKNFNGIDTPFQQLAALEAWYAKARATLDGVGGPAQDFLRLLLQGPIEHLATLRRWAETNGRSLQMIRSLKSHVLKAAERDPDHALDIARSTLEELADALRLRITTLQAVLATAQQLSLAPTKAVAEVPALLRKLDSYRRQDARILSNRTMERLLGPSFAGSRTSIPPLQDALTWSHQAADLPLPPEIGNWLFSRDYPARRTAIEPILTQLRAEARTWHHAWTTFSGLLHLDLARWTADELPATVSSLIGRTQRAVAHPDSLRDWVEYLGAGEALAREGGPQVRQLIEAGELPIDDVPQAFELFVWNSLAQSLVEQHSELRDFDSIEQERLQEQAVEGARSLLLARRNHLRSKTQRPLPPGNAEGAVKSWTDRGLLTRAIAGDAPQVGVRQLFAQAGPALTALMPCHLMSPLAVAQYLPSGRPSFDLVIVDEAARLRPVEVIGAMARAKQVVLIGDSRQLPPTTSTELFVQSESGEEEHASAASPETALAWAEARYGRALSLRQHYRSRHDSLMAFPNRVMYDGSLAITPSPAPGDRTLGLACHVVEQGYYRDGSNQPEADALVEAAIRHAAKQPDLSLGIVTTTVRQQELIYDLLDRRLDQDRALRSFVAAREGTPGSLFVKTLERAQRDVRDVILVSLAFGRDKEGSFRSHFGCLEGPQGPRYLNVLATRASRRLDVFCSFDPATLDERTLAARGAGALKAFLRYAHSRKRRSLGEEVRSPESPLSQALTRMLNARGFLVDARVGPTDCLVDLAVRHPDLPGRYLLALLCDAPSVEGAGPGGPTDRRREARLRELDWPVHRIWSAAWYQNPHREFDRLLTTLRALLERESDNRPAPPPLVSPGLPRHDPDLE